MVTGVLYRTKTTERTRLNLPYNMIWAGRRDHLVGDTTPLQDMPLSSAEEKRKSSECSSIPRPAGSVTLQKSKEKNHNDSVRDSYEEQ